ncbi:hypothetical protein FSP39_013798 [Pinctada imbricata]|uniref:Beta-lactamase-related domain-containing protein n=1 Tax=Pinctada imbricata TaxID=66713 RepID=A0AA88YEW7_PINIB|nr:hypothetical protein FSP39_013798 [Pinctada imbricata]
MKLLAAFLPLLGIVSGTVDTSGIAAYVSDTFACNGGTYKGLSISVVQNGQVLYSDGFGVRDTVGNVAVSNKTLFGIGGLTKAFTAALVYNLTVDKGYSRDVDTSLRSMLDDKTLFRSSMRSRYATLRDLLAHRMGYNQHNFMRLNLNRSQIIERIRELPIKSRFRDSYRHSNLFYGYVTYLVEFLGNNTFETLMQQKVFDPLQMADSSFFTTADFSGKNYASGYIDNYGTAYEVPMDFLKKWAELSGSGGIVSTADDMAKWMMFNLNGTYNQQGNYVMKSSIVKDLHKPWNRIQSASVEDHFKKPKTDHSVFHSSYGLGWKSGSYRGYDIITHGGSTYGYDSLITLVPHTQIGVYTAVTGNDHDYIYQTNIHNKIIDELLGLTPWVNATYTCSYSKDNTPAQTAPTFAKNYPFPYDASYYVGDYTDAAYGNLSISEEAGNLKMKYGIATFDMFSQDADSVAPTNNRSYIVSTGITHTIIDDGQVLFKQNNLTMSHFDEVVLEAFDDDQPPKFQRIHH